MTLPIGDSLYFAFCENFFWSTALLVGIRRSPQACRMPHLVPVTFRNGENQRRSLSSVSQANQAVRAWAGRMLSSAWRMA